MTNDEMTSEARKQIIQPLGQMCDHIWRASVRSEKKCACVRLGRCCLCTVHAGRPPATNVPCLPTLAFIFWGAGGGKPRRSIRAELLPHILKLRRTTIEPLVGLTWVGCSTGPSTELPILLRNVHPGAQSVICARSFGQTGTHTVPRASFSQRLRVSLCAREVPRDLLDELVKSKVTLRARDRSISLPQRNESAVRRKRPPTSKLATCWSHGKVESLRISRTVPHAWATLVLWTKQKGRTNPSSKSRTPQPSIRGSHEATATTQQEGSFGCTETRAS